MTMALNDDRLNTTRRNLNQLRKEGYRYIVTPDDGDTWVGSEDKGLEIDELMISGFIGKVEVDGKI